MDIKLIKFIEIIENVIVPKFSMDPKSPKNYA